MVDLLIDVALGGEKREEGGGEGGGQKRGVNGVMVCILITLGCLIREKKGKGETGGRARSARLAFILTSLARPEREKQERRKKKADRARAAAFLSSARPSDVEKKRRGGVAPVRLRSFPKKKRRLR